MENPLTDPNSKLANVLSIIDLSTTLAFTAEIILKIIAYGFIFNGENSFLSNSAHQLDLFVTTISVSKLF